MGGAGLLSGQGRLLEGREGRGCRCSHWIMAATVTGGAIGDASVALGVAVRRRNGTVFRRHKGWGRPGVLWRARRRQGWAGRRRSAARQRWQR